MRATAIVGLLAIAASALAQDSAEGARPTVRVYVRKNVSDGNLNMIWAESIASRIFAEAGVRIKWQAGEPGRGERNNAILIDLTSNPPKTLAPGALAWARAYEGVHIKVFWDRVQDAAGSEDRLRTFLLAHVIAHEIVHILEGINRHSETGLMKAHWTRTEIEEMSVKSLSLAPEDVRLIHRGLLK